MSLEAILKLRQQVDEHLQERFTKIGQRIPHAAYLTTPVALTGLYFLINSGIRGFVPGFSSLTMAPNFFFGLLQAHSFVIGQEVKGELNGPELAENPAYANPFLRFVRSYCRAVRLPMLIGAGVAAAKVGYDLAALAIGGEPLDGHTLAAFEAGAGLFVNSSLLYLLDPNHSLPQKRPLKALLGKAQAAYERVKDALRLPFPSPMPQPVQAYSAFSNAGVQKH